MIFKKEQFKKIRQQNRWSLALLAEKSGISRRSLSLWENGKRIPTEKNIRNIAHFLKVPVNHISDLPAEQEVSQKDISQSANLWFELSQSAKENTNYQNLIYHASILNTKLEQASVIIRGLLTSLHSIFYIKDVNLKYIIVNNSFLENVSLNTSYKVIGKSDEDFFSATEAKLNHEQDKIVLRSGNAIKNIEQYIPGSRKKKWGIISKLPITDNENKTIGILGIFFDITEKKENEKIRELLEIHIAAMTASVSISQANFKKYLYLNKGHENIYGYSNNIFYEEKHEYWLYNCIHPDDRETEKNYIATKGWPSKYEYRIVKPNGEIRWIESQVSKNIKYKNQECIIAIETDITEKKNISLKRIMLENAISSIDDGIIISETNTIWAKALPKVKYINVALKKILGISNLDFFETSCIHSLATETCYNELKKKFSNPAFPLTLEYDINKVNNGKTITVSEKIFNYSGNMYLSVIRDITEQTKEKEIRGLIEDSLKSSNDIIWFRETATNKLIYVSESVTKLTGFPIESFKKDPDFWQNNCVHPEDKISYEKNLRNDIWPRTLRYRIIDTSGTIRWIQTIIFYKSPKDKVYRAVDRDITKQINAEQEKQNQIKIDIAKKLLDNSIPLSIIEETTGLSYELIKSL